MDSQVELVLAVIEQRWARIADPSQVRYFIFKVHTHVSGAEHAVQALLCDRLSDVCCDGMLSESLSSPAAWPCAGAGGMRSALLAILCSRPHQVCIPAAAPTVQGLLQVPAPQSLQLQQQQGGARSCCSAAQHVRRACAG
jgi:hypothetical protein